MTQTLAEYYSTNYTHCIIDDSFWGSRQGLQYTSHFTQLFACPVQLLTFYLIVFKTPNMMKCMIWPLLVSHFWCAALDFSFGTLSPPYLFYPHGALFGCGILNFIGIPIWILIIPAIFVLCSMAISMIYLFESRASAIPHNVFRIENRRTRVLYYTLNYLAYIPTLWLLSNIPENQDLAKLEALKITPCPTREYFTEPTFMLFSDPKISDMLIFRIFSFYIFITSAQIGFFIYCLIYYLYCKASQRASQQTRKLQIHYFIGILVQTMVPIILIVLTYGVLIISIYLGRITQGIVNMCIATVGVHGLAESVAIIMIHGPYRKAVREMILKKKVTKGEIPIENRGYVVFSESDSQVSQLESKTSSRRRIKVSVWWTMTIE